MGSKGPGERWAPFQFLFGLGYDTNPPKITRCLTTEEQRARVCVVLVRARNPNNIGAVARAMHGFGFTDLRIVNEYSVPLERPVPPWMH